MTKIYGKIAALTVLGILSFTAMIMTAIFGLSEKFSSSLLWYSALSAVVTWWVIRSIIRLNNSFKDEIKAHMHDASEFIAEWECSEQEWQTFIREQLSHVGDTKITALLSGSIVGIMCLFLFKLEFSWLISILAGAGVFIVFGGFIFLLVRFFARLKFTRYAKSRTGKVVLSRTAVQIADHLVDWSLGIFSLGSVQLDESFECPVIVLEVESQTANGTNYTTHTVPVPKSKLEEARKIVEYYNSTL